MLPTPPFLGWILRTPIVDGMAVGTTELRRSTVGPLPDCGSESLINAGVGLCSC